MIHIKKLYCEMCENPTEYCTPDADTVSVFGWALRAVSQNVFVDCGRVSSEETFVNFIPATTCVVLTLHQTRLKWCFALHQLTCRLSWLPQIEQFISAVKLTCSLSTADHFAAAAADASLIPLPSQHAPVGPVSLWFPTAWCIEPCWLLLWCSRSIRRKNFHFGKYNFSV